MPSARIEIKYTPKEKKIINHTSQRCADRNVEIKNVYDIVNTWPNKGFYETFIRITQKYLEMSRK